MPRTAQFSLSPKSTTGCNARLTSPFLWLSPATALTIAGNFTSSAGGATSVSYTAAQNITVNGVTTIGSNCTFNGASYIFAFKGNWINNGTFTGSSLHVSRIVDVQRWI